MTAHLKLELLGGSNLKESTSVENLTLQGPLRS